MEYTKLTKLANLDDPSIANENIFRSKCLKLFMMEYLVLCEIKGIYDLIYFGSAPGYHIKIMMDCLLYTVKCIPKKCIFIDNKKKTCIKVDDDNIVISKSIELENVKKLTSNPIVLIINNYDGLNVDFAIKYFNPIILLKKFNKPEDIKGTISLKNIYVPSFTRYDSTELYYHYIKGMEKNDKMDKDATKKIIYYNRYLKNDLQLYNDKLSFSCFAILEKILKTKNDFLNTPTNKIKALVLPKKKQQVTKVTKVTKKPKVTKPKVS